MSRGKALRRCVCLLLAVQLLRLPVLAQEATSAPTQGSEPAQAERSERDRRMLLILGGTVVGVTGMWLTLYKRGK